MRRVVLVAFLLSIQFKTIVLTAQQDTLRVVLLGQVDGALLGQMQAMPCGPYFTVTPTDSGGGGLLHLAVESDTRVVHVVTVPLGTVQLKICEKCLPPTVVAKADGESSVHMEMAMPRAHIKLSPCLRRARLIK